MGLSRDRELLQDNYAALARSQGLTCEFVRVPDLAEKYATRASGPTAAPRTSAPATAPVASAARPDLSITAYHEAAHVVGAFALGIPVVRVAVMDDGSGRTSYGEAGVSGMLPIHRAALAFCGPMGEAMVVGESRAWGEGARGDLASVAALGLSSAQEYRARDVARTIISTNFEAVRDLAHELRAGAVLGESDLQRVWSRVRPHRVS